VRAINKGVFVCLVIKGSPAALAGLRFGDQILQVNGTVVAGFSMDEVHSLFHKSPVNGISVMVRDRFVFTEGFHLVSRDSSNCFKKFFDALLQKI
jgi:C-terminal processing protease CtpA/Prc